MKRGHGIHIISETLKKLDEFNYDNFFIELFKTYLSLR